MDKKKEKERKMESIDQPKNTLSAKLCTRIVAIRIHDKKGLWKIESRVFPALIEDDAGVVVTIKEGTTVAETNLVLWSVAQQLLKLEKKQKKNRKRAGKIISNMKAKQLTKTERLRRLSVKLFYLPAKLIEAIRKTLNKVVTGGK